MRYSVSRIKRPRFSGVYQIRNKLNNKVYIGSSARRKISEAAKRRHKTNNLFPELQEVK